MTQDAFKEAVTKIDSAIDQFLDNLTQRSPEEWTPSEWTNLTNLRKQNLEMKAKQMMAQALQKHPTPITIEVTQDDIDGETKTMKIEELSNEEIWKLVQKSGSQ